MREAPDDVDSAFERWFANAIQWDLRFYGTIDVCRQAYRGGFSRAATEKARLEGAAQALLAWTERLEFNVGEMAHLKPVQDVVRAALSSGQEGTLR